MNPRTWEIAIAMPRNPVRIAGVDGVTDHGIGTGG